MAAAIITEPRSGIRLLAAGILLSGLTACVTGGVRPASEALVTTPASAPAPVPVVATPLRREEPAVGAVPLPGPDQLLARTLADFPPLPELDHAAADAKAPAPGDLWPVLREGFALPQPEQRRIAQELRWFARHPDYLRRVFDRARPWLAWIHQEIRRRGMPAEIALLPVVESGFNPYAYSHGRAAGIWQFIPGTGRRFGLVQDWWYDGRRDVIDSTRAALDYLQFLHEEFDGDWLLALAAYNSGEGTVQKAVRRNRRSGRPTDFWHLRLPRETRGYVPRLLALARLVASPEQYGVELPRIDPTPAFAIVDTGGQIDLALAAELAGIDLETLQRFNPAFNRWATRPQGPHRLVLPAKAAERFRTRLAKLDPDERIQWVRHRVRRGETLIAIAKRHETTVALLREVNGLRSDRIRAGSHLLIPKARRALTAYPLSSVARRDALIDSGRSRGATVYRVRPGDTLWEIARRHGVGVRRLAKWNGMAPGDPLRPGRKLVIRNSSTRTSASPTTQRIVYTVRKGDSLARISHRFKVSIEDLRRWNRDRLRGRYLQPGQRLTLYVDVRRQSGST